MDQVIKKRTCIMTENGHLQVLLQNKTFTGEQRFER